MIKSWHHKGLKKFYESGEKSGIVTSHAKRLKMILQFFDRATCPKDMNLWDLGFYELKGEYKGF